MSEGDPSSHSPQRRRIMRYAAIGFGLSLVALPVGFLLWRSSNSASRVQPTIRTARAPPARRIATRNTPISTATTQGEHIPSINVPNSRAMVKEYLAEGDGIRSYMPRREEITQSTAWLAFRSFSIATLGVLGVFGVGTGVVVWTWDIKSIDDFHRKMQSRIRRLLNSQDTPNQDMEIIKNSISKEDVDAWTWDKAKERMGEAVDKGDPIAWLAVAMRELELSYQKDRSEKGKSP